MTSSAVVLKTEGLTKSFLGFVAVQDVNFTLHEGHIHAVIGPNGAGKTTFFNLLTKFLPPTSGRISYRGEDITRLKPAQIARRGVVRSFQISATFPHLTVLENVRVALQRRLGTFYHFWRSESFGFSTSARANCWRRSGCRISPSSRPSNYPYGRKRALEIATTIALDPDLILLDEPTQGMGHEDIDRVKALIMRVAAGRTVLMVEHNMSVVSDISDRITVLQRGQILAEGTYAEVSGDPRVVSAYLGTAH